MAELGGASMLSSMTGYGSAVYEDDERRVRCEARSVNHRYLDISIRLPRPYMALEERVRRVVSERVARGRIEIFVLVEEFSGKRRTMSLDTELLRNYMDAIQEARKIADLEGRLSVDTLVTLPDIIRVTEEEVDVETVWPSFEFALQSTLDKLVEMRRSEGERLASDISARIQWIDGALQQIAQRAPEVVQLYHERLQRRVAEWQNDVSIDPDRIAAEVALFAERADISEEIVRARSHVQEFLASCQSGSAVGRKLDFLLQELNREINTIGSKANDTEISNHVVAIKSEIEKVREQVQNVE